MNPEPQNQKRPYNRKPVSPPAKQDYEPAEVGLRTRAAIPPCPPMTLAAGTKTPAVVEWKAKYGHLIQS